MNNYVDNVIPFPVRPDPGKAQPTRPIDSLPADIIPFLTGKPRERVQRKQELPPGKHVNQYITFEHLKKLDFPIMDSEDIYEDSEILDRYLVALSAKFGHTATEKLAHVIGEYLAVVADVAFAEGLAESALPDDEDMEF